MGTFLKNNLTNPQLKLLVVEDNSEEAELIEEFLLTSNFGAHLSITRAERIGRVQQLLNQESFDAI